MARLLLTDTGFYGVVARGAGARCRTEQRTSGVLAELAAGAGLQSPPTTVVERAEIAARASDLPTPAVIKPLRSKVAAAGGLQQVMVRRVESPAELRAAAAAMPGERLLVQRTCRSARIGRRRGLAGGTGLREPQCAPIFPPVCRVSAYTETVPRDRGWRSGSRDCCRLSAGAGSSTCSHPLRR